MSNTGENIYERRDGRWEGRYICGRKPDGRARYVSVYGRSRTEVQTKIQECLQTCTSESEPSDIRQSDLTVNQLFELFLRRANVKRSTYARYKTVIDLHILPWFGKRQACTLTAKELSAYLREKRRNGNLRTGGALSEKSVRDLAVLIKSALRFAQRELHVYADAINMPLPPYKQKRVRTFSEPEIQRMEAEMQKRLIGRILRLCWHCAPACGSAKFVRCGYPILIFWQAQLKFDNLPSESRPVRVQNCWCRVPKAMPRSERSRLRSVCCAGSRTQFVGSREMHMC